LCVLDEKIIMGDIIGTLMLCLDLKMDLIWECVESWVVWIKGKIVRFEEKVCEGCDRCDW